VHELKRKVTASAQWDALAQYNVIVTTPFTISPAIAGIAPPPVDFFDLLLVDEAHHSPAKSWAAVLTALPSAHKALFTATPFRRDRREIKGQLVFNYPLGEARKDHVFGDISFVPVLPSRDQDPDVAIALAVERALAEDRNAGFLHSVLVRVDSKTRGEELVVKYQRSTQLKLRVIHSGMSDRFVKQTIQKLRARDLDGVIAVNMLGEGFDFPNLKIAALHTPHRSLGVTLQFIGRFARVGDTTIGPARFFAIPAEIKGETDKLFKEGSSWQELVIGLSEGRVEAEQETRRDLATFESPTIAEQDLADLSLYALKPGRHVKVYQVPFADIAAPLTLPLPFETAFSQISPELSTAIYVVSEQKKPKWADIARLGQLRHELFVVYYNSDAQLLFICASRKADSLYRYIGAHYAGNAAKILPLYKINRVLAGLTNITCHNVGMRNRLHSSHHETYRIISGTNTQQAIRKTDARLFHRGHVSCTAHANGERVSIGYSSASKIWSPNTGSISGLIRWCEMLATKIATEQATVKAPGLELLSVGEPLIAIPENVLAVDWDTEVYTEDIDLSFIGADGQASDVPLLDADLEIDRPQCSQRRIRVTMSCKLETWSLDFDPHGQQFFSLANGSCALPVVHHDDSDLSLIDFLNEYPLHFYFADFSRLRGEEWFPCKHEIESFQVSQIQVVDWNANGVNIQKEFWKDNEARNGNSIHDHLERVLNTHDYPIVFYDHRSGEVADFLTLQILTNETLLTLYHCKKSGGATAGRRVDDVYDVCGQVIKSFNLINYPDDLIKHVRRRSQDGSRFIRGNLAQFERIMNEAKTRRLTYQLIAVQPGIARSQLENTNGSVLAAANEYLHQIGANDLIVWGSA